MLYGAESENTLPAGWLQNTKTFKRADEQSPEVVQATLEGQYPAIELRVKREGAEFTGVMRLR